MTTHPIEHMNETVEFCALVVEQGITFLENLSSLDSSSPALSTKEILERKSQIIPNSVIGRHLKHTERRLTLVLDLIEGRTREPLSYEGGPRALDDVPVPPISSYRSNFKSLRDRLSALPQSSLSHTVSIRRGPEVIKSTAVRELYAAAFHAIHHYAIMGGLLREFLGPEEAAKFIPKRFGFKPKTSGTRARL